MTTILLEKNKKEIKREYILKFLNRFVWKLTLVAIVWLILEATIFYSIQIEKRSLADKIGEGDQKRRDEIREELDNSLQSLNEMNMYFNTETLHKTNVVNYVFNFKPQGVEINTVSVNDDEDGQFVSVSGIASNRDILLKFTQGIERGIFTKDFDLPLSSFTKNFDIPFSLTFKYKDE